jgi:hypothetical protein
MMKKLHIYLIGVVLFGLVYEPAKAALRSGLWFFCVAVIYLLVLRFIAERFGKP